ncbi:hypothetical protein VB773_10975 [Haloarculaceae archaeon H-GB2-1]|nr:hypothetical protein [Haloarculaceae archaeon H-GB11]MEA5408028.1 hypothetical protein [Haloarculaceae archaeon H-GB2-1]
MTGTVQGVVASLGVLASTGLQAFIVLVITFYLLRDDHRLAAWARRTFAPKGRSSRRTWSASTGICGSSSSGTS